MTYSAEVFQRLKGIMKKKFGQQATNVGDEGGFAPNVSTPQEAIDLIHKAVDEAGQSGKFSIALDVAASEFYDEATKS